MIFHSGGAPDLHPGAISQSPGLEAALHPGKFPKVPGRRLSAEELMLLTCGVGEDLRVPWTARRSNQSILKEISPGMSLEGMMLKLKLQYFGRLGFPGALPQRRVVWMWFGAFPGAFGLGRAQPRDQGSRPC